jgi:hypothetical protein
MRADLLHVVAVRSNPLQWHRPEAVCREFIAHMLDSGVQLTIVEVQYGDRPFIYQVPHVNHIGLRAKTMVWCKENAMNIAISRLPDARYVCCSDADVFHRRKDWARETVEALQLYDVIQPWSEAYDLGPNDEHMTVHKSFCSLYHRGLPVAPDGISKFWKADGGPYDYAHSGFTWAYTRQALDWLGGLFEVGGMGSGDYHMALSLVGKAEQSLVGKASLNYRSAVLEWQDRAIRHINKNIGYIPGTIEHRFHGRKVDRAYLSRWDMFVRHGFDPRTDLKRNIFGLYEWTGNKPELKREFDLYLRARNEDVNNL